MARNTPGLSTEAPRVAAAGVNDFGKPGRGGPCPPVGRHRYVFKLCALSVRLPVLPRATKAQLERAMQGHVLAQARLAGTYSRGGH
ncbi:MAG: YbhB/YbcL family Raf kinase inhibitor-like protein [Burkholderiales bacterium]|nr:YbhB/YbcL family Raf kinase inhibitor-like protein [Burkholderiales bacterium]